MTILGVDIGTTAMKMGVFRAEGESLSLIRQFTRHYEVNTYNDGLFSDIEPEKWRLAFLEGCREMEDLMGKIDAMSGKVITILARMGYNDSDPVTYNIKSDFTLMYQALYSTDGTSNLKLLNDNQVILGNKSDTMSGKITDGVAAINAHTTDQVGGLNFNMLVIIFMICLFIAGIVIFRISSYKGKNSIREVKAPAESLFVPTLQAQPQQTVEQIVDGMPNCFKKMYNGNSNDCKACGVRSECSGRFVKRTPQ